MYTVAIKTIKIIFLGFLPLLLISNTSKDTELMPLVLSGTYLLEVDGNTDYKIAGDISFRSLNKISSTGTVFSVLKLNFNGEKSELPHDMEIVVCKESKTNSLPLGNYKVNTVESFLNPSDGVFGAFSSNTLGEKLFFTKKGGVRITHVSNTNVKGTLSMVLLNSKGETINIKGDFDAR
ncbi:hypothetical protein ACFQZJ_01125 [Maribacter chungangensis]|uniref:Lipocalin-like domain-containing protein n=1 Tax=Maribacter chungangensis TaxID=1069117 RepID=A0ABW3AYC2_9FLAO